MIIPVIKPTEATEIGQAFASSLRKLVPLWRMPLAVVLLLSAVIAMGCGADATRPPAQSFDAKGALREAVVKLLELESAAFTLEHISGSTALIPGFLDMSKVYGVVDIPDRFELTVEAETIQPRSFVEVRVVTIEDQAYMTDILSGKWQQVEPAVLPFTFANFAQTLADIIEAVDAPTLVGAERLGDSETNHIRGRIMSEDLGNLVPRAANGLEVILDLWLEQSTNLLQQVLISGRVIATDEPGTVRQLTLGDINIPVEISAPELGR